jgi:hypothetical protein
MRKIKYKLLIFEMTFLKFSAVYHLDAKNRNHDADQDPVTLGNANPDPQTPHTKPDIVPVLISVGA